MPLIQLVEVLIVVGVLLWLVNRFIPNAGIHQVNFERRSGDCGGSVAAECFWAVSFPFCHPSGKRMRCVASPLEMRYET
jgi:hypothetical protein